MKLTAKIYKLTAPETNQLREHKRPNPSLFIGHGGRLYKNHKKESPHVQIVWETIPNGELFVTKHLPKEVLRRYLVDPIIKQLGLDNNLNSSKVLGLLYKEGIAITFDRGGALSQKGNVYHTYTVSTDRELLPEDMEEEEVQHD